MSEHPQTHHGEDLDDPAAAPTWVIGLMSVALLGFTFLALHGVETIAAKNEVETKQMRVEPQELLDLVAEQDARINRSAHWERVVIDGQEVDRYLTIPIEDAMRAIEREAGG